jgi:hypothetical protein
MLINIENHRMNEQAQQVCCPVLSEITGQILRTIFISVSFLKKNTSFRGFRDLPSYCERIRSLTTSWFSFSNENTQDVLKLTDYNVGVFSLTHC